MWLREDRRRSVTAPDDAARVINKPEDLDKLSFGSIVAMISHSRNIPMVIVFQKGSLEHGGGGWCTPEAIGQIPAEAVFEFIALNGYPQEITVLHEPNVYGSL